MPSENVFVTPEKLNFLKDKFQIPGEYNGSGVISFIDKWVDEFARSSFYSFFPPDFTLDNFLQSLVSLGLSEKMIRKYGLENWASTFRLNLNVQPEGLPMTPVKDFNVMFVYLNPEANNEIARRPITGMLVTPLEQTGQDEGINSGKFMFKKRPDGSRLLLPEKQGGFQITTTDVYGNPDWHNDDLIGLNAVLKFTAKPMLEQQINDDYVPGLPEGALAWFPVTLIKGKCIWRDRIDAYAKAWKHHRGNLKPSRGK